jgi:hypothetical protein
LNDRHPATSLDVHGQCHCGAVHLTATVNPAKVFVCHCADCQVLTGSAFRVVVPAVPGSFQVVGAVKEYARRAESGAVRLQAFCPDCGTPLFARSEAADGLATLRVGALAERDHLVPSAQLWQRSAQSWVDSLADLPGCQRQELLG